MGNVRLLRDTSGLYRDNGKENKNYYIIIGHVLHRTMTIPDGWFGKFALLFRVFFM